MTQILGTRISKHIPPENFEDILEAIKKVKGVFNVKALYPDAPKKGELARIFEIEVDGGSQCDRVMRSIGGITGLEYVESPSQHKPMRS